MSALEALRASRLHDQLSPNQTHMEERRAIHTGYIDGFTEDQYEGMAKLGHNVVKTPGKCKHGL